MDKITEQACGKEQQENASFPVIRNDIVDIDKLIPYVHNARVHSSEQVEQLAASIAEFGVTNSILVWKNNEIIAGHGRVMAMKLLLARDPVKWGYLRNVEVRRCDGLSDMQRRALILADNKLALNASWDQDILKNAIEELGDFDLSVIGFSDEELESLFMFEGEQVDLQSAVSKQPIFTYDKPFTMSDSSAVANEHWVGMPEFNQQDKMPYRTLYVHFESDEDARQFSILINQTITDKTKFIWYPEAKKAIVADKVYSSTE